MTEQTECRWIWGKPDKAGLWWHKLNDAFSPFVANIRHPRDCGEQWWAYIGPAPPEPLPPKRKVTQTMWMVPISVDNAQCYVHGWYSSDDTIPPGAIETVQTREVEQ